MGTPDTKKEILKATIKLLKKEPDLHKITVRRIATDTGIAISQINYHFQSKENLINMAVQTFINEVITRGSAQVMTQNFDDPVEKLRRRVKQAAAFVAENPAISRISILTDMTNGTMVDNSSQGALGYLEIMKEIYQDKLKEKELKLKVWLLMSGFQVAFLRTTVFQEFTGIDFSDAQQRDDLIDEIIDTIIGV